MGPLFISYAHEDRSRAELLASGLSGQGIEVWWDREIRPGHPSFHRAIQDALERASCVVVLWSAHSVDSRYVEIEASFAWEREVLLPVLIEDVASRVPVAFRNVQAADLTDWAGDTSDPAFLDLTAAIATRLEAGSRSTAERIRASIRQSVPRIASAARRLDAWDLLVAALLVAVALGAWGLAGPASLVLAEEFLWVGATLLAFGLWLTVRSVRRERWFPPRRRIRRACTRAAVVVVAAAVWAFAADAVYGVARVPADRHGIVVTRLEADIADGAQTTLVRALQDRIPRDGLTDEVVALRAPRRVQTEKEARTVGLRAAAAMVFWGRVDRWSADGTPIISSHLTPVDVPGVFDPRTLAAAGVPGLAAEMPTVELSGELGTIQRILPRFVAGYALYRTGDPERAASYMRAVASELEHGSRAEQRTVAETLLASALFYLGNAAVLRGDFDGAVARYRAAVEHSLHPSEADRPQFLQAVNNLGMIFTWTGQGDSAIARFEQADLECRSAGTNPFCDYIWYNLGNEYSRAGRYSIAHELFRRVADRLRSDLTRKDTALSRLRGYAYRGLAYTNSRMAVALPDEAKRMAAYRAALDDWNAAEQSFRYAGLAVPADFVITRARVDLGLGRFADAAAHLDSAEIELTDNPVIALLRAALATCMNRLPAAAAEIRRYLDLADSAAAAGMVELRELSNTCATTAGG